MKEIHEEIKPYWATWLPGRRIRVGDCGPLKGIDFDNNRTLADYGISFDTRPGNTWPLLRHFSRRGVEFSPSAVAGALVGKADVVVKFTRANSVLFAATDVRERSMRHKGAVAAKLTEAGFPADYAVVSDVLVARSLTVLVSRESGESVTVHVALPVGTPIGPTEIGSALNYSGTGATGFAIVGAAHMTPLYRIMKPPKLPRSVIETIKDGVGHLLSRITFGYVAVADPVEYVDFDAAYSASESELVGSD
jgi:hypothetical protein